MFFFVGLGYDLASGFVVIGQCGIVSFRFVFSLSLASLRVGLRRFVGMWDVMCLFGVFVNLNFLRVLFYVRCGVSD